MSNAGSPCATEADCQNPFTQACLSPDERNPFFNGTWGICSCHSTSGGTNPQKDGCTTMNGESWFILLCILWAIGVDICGFYNAQRVFKTLPDKQRRKTVGFCLLSICFASFWQYVFHLSTIPGIFLIDAQIWSVINKIGNCFGASFSKFPFQDVIQ